MANAFIYELTDVWDNSGTSFNALKMNVTDTASAATSKLFDFQVGGVSRGSLDKSGNLIITGDLTAVDATFSGALDVSGISNASTVRSDLGLAIGTDVLAYDANLQGFVTAFTLPTSDGTANQVLQTDGAGTISFVDVGGGDTLKAENENISGIWAGGQADTIADLAARDVSGLDNGDVTFVAERRRWGHFEWNTADRSSDVTADPQQGIWVAPSSDPTGASGAWQRVYNDDLHVDWFIQSSDPDDTNGIQACLNFAIDGQGIGAEFQRGTTVRFGRHDYYVSSTITPVDGGVNYGWLRIVGVGLPTRTNFVDISTAPNTSSGGTVVIGTHASGDVFRFKIGPVLMENIRVDSTWARKGGGDANGCGVRAEPPDDTNAASTLSGITLKNVYCLNQPGHGIAIIGNSVKTTLENCLGGGCFGHGIVFDRGYLVGRQHLNTGGTSTSDISTTSGSTTITSVSNFFSGAAPGDKLIIEGAGLNGYWLETTIATVVSATQVTVNNAASTTTTGAFAQLDGDSGRPGLAELRSCYGVDNGGHGLAVGSPQHGFQLPYRFNIYNLECFRNASDASRRYNEYGVWIYGEGYNVWNSASDGRESGTNTIVRPAWFCAGRFFTLNNNRVVASNGAGIFIGDQTAVTSDSGTDTGVSGAETSNFSIDGVFVVSGGNVVDAVSIDSNVTGPMQVKNIDGDHTGLDVGGTTTDLFWHRSDGSIQYRGELKLNRGTVSEPVYSFADDTDTGLYSSAVNRVDISVGGSNVASFVGSQIISGDSNTTTSGAAAPSFTWGTDSDTGMYRHTVDTIGFSTAGTLAMTIDTDDITPYVQIKANAGSSASAPPYSFAGDPDTGVFRPTTNVVAVASGGSESFRFTSGALQSASIGSASAPVYSFRGDTDTGFYSPGANIMNLTTGGTVRANFSSTGLDIQNGGKLLIGSSTVIDETGGVSIQSQTLSQLNNAAAVVNTTNKRVGKLVFNTTDNEVYVATGTATTSDWKSLEDGTTITPT